MLRVVVELEVPHAVVEQIKRGGLELRKEGGALAVRVPNQTLPAGSATIRLEEVNRAG